MKNEKSLSRGILGVAAVTGVLLTIPLIAMQFTNEVVWTALDFIVAGALLFAVGSAYVLATRSAPNILYRAAMALGLGGTLFMIWANLAVGLIGAGPNPGNLMYIVVVFVGIIGAFRSRLESHGMEIAMYAMALTVVFITAIALMTGMDRYPGSSMYEILGVNAFLATPFVMSGLFFRFSTPQHTPADGK